MVIYIYLDIKLIYIYNQFIIVLIIVIEKLFDLYDLKLIKLLRVSLYINKKIH